MLLEPPAAPLVVCELPLAPNVGGPALPPAVCGAIPVYAICASYVCVWLMYSPSLGVCDSSRSSSMSAACATSLSVFRSVVGSSSSDLCSDCISVWVVSDEKVTSSPNRP